MKQPSNLPQNSPPDLQNQGRALTFMPTGLWMLFSIVLMFTVSYLISGLSSRAVTLAEKSMINTLYELGAIGIPILLMFFLYNRDRKSLFRAEVPSAKEIWITLLLSLFLFVANSALTIVNTTITSLWAPMPAQSMPAAVTLWDKLAYLLSVMVAAPILEELLFRGAFQRGLESRGKWFSIIVAGAFFGTMHMTYDSVIPKILMGIVMCYVVYCTGSIFLSIIIHMINNGISAILLFTIDYSSTAQQFTRADAAALLPRVPMYLLMTAVLALVIVGLLRRLKAAAVSSTEGISNRACSLRQPEPGEVYRGFAALFALVLAFVIHVGYMALQFISNAADAL